MTINEHHEWSTTAQTPPSATYLLACLFIYRHEGHPLLSLHFPMFLTLPGGHSGPLLASLAATFFRALFFLITALCLISILFLCFRFCLINCSHANYRQRAFSPTMVISHAPSLIVTPSCLEMPTVAAVKPFQCVSNRSETLCDLKPQKTEPLPFHRNTLQDD